MRTAFFMPFPGTLYCTLVYLDEVNLNFIHYFCYMIICLILMWRNNIHG